MATYTVRVKGCDDTTEFEIELDEHEFATATRLAEACNAASDGGCQPRIEIQEGGIPDDDDR